MPTNRITGERFEEELAEYLAVNGMWVHRLTQNKSGQPADIIAVNKHYAMLIDCKVCARGYFVLSRAEPNQLTAMQMWEEKTKRTAYFALLCQDTGDYWMLPYGVLRALLDEGRSTIHACEMERYCIELTSWMGVWRE